VLALTVIGIPFAVFYLVRKAVTTQACVIEELAASASLRRSSEVIKRHELRVFAITALVNVTAFLLGPIVGVAVLFLTSSSLAVIDVIGSLVYAVVMPYAGIAIALLFYDLRRRHVEAPAVSPSAIVAPTASH
jgi:ABC-type multidrug transport system fused ATPase/permease subunit